MAHVYRSRVHTSEAGALGGRPLAMIVVAARALCPREALPGDWNTMSGCC